MHFHAPGATFHDTILPEYTYKGTEKAAKIHTRTIFFHIITVEFCLDGNLQFISAIDLRPSGESGKHIIGTVFIPFRDQIILVPERRSRSHDAHVPFEDIEDLRELIQTGATQKFPVLVIYCSGLLSIWVGMSFGVSVRMVRNL